MAYNLERAIGQAQAPVGLSSAAPLTVADDHTDSHAVPSRQVSREAPREATTGDGAFYDDSIDPGRTLTDLHATVKPKSATDALPAESTLGQVEDEKAGQVEKEKDITAIPLSAERNTLKDLPPGRKNVLMLCFCLAMFSE